MRDRDGLLNLAMANFGAKPLQSFDEESPGGRAARLVYGSIVDTCLGFYPWSFSRRTVALDQIDETPINGWSSVFLLPAGALSLPHSVLRDPRRPDEPLKEWTVEDGRLFANDVPLWAVCSFRSDPESWSPVFFTAVSYALSAALAVPISGNASGVVETMRGLAFGSPSENMRGGFMGQAIMADARNQPSRTLSLGASPLISARVR
jgi:hypothetical protein